MLHVCVWCLLSESNRKTSQGNLDTQRYIFSASTISFLSRIVPVTLFSHPLTFSFGSTWCFVVVPLQLHLAGEISWVLSVNFPSSLTITAGQSCSGSNTDQPKPFPNHYPSLPWNQTDRNEDTLKRYTYPSIWTFEPCFSHPLKNSGCTPWESHAERRKRLKPGTNQRKGGSCL